MGADLLLARSRWPQHDNGELLELDVARVVLHERCNTLGVGELVELYDGTVSVYGAEDDIDTADMSSAELAEMTRRCLHAAIDAVTDEGSWRELVSLSFDGKEWVLTGGMSWGDVPTEIFGDVCILGDSGICAAPVVRTEEEGGDLGGAG